MVVSSLDLDIGSQASLGRVQDIGLDERRYRNAGLTAGMLAQVTLTFASMIVKSAVLTEVPI